MHAGSAVETHKEMVRSTKAHCPALSAESRRHALPRANSIGSSWVSEETRHLQISHEHSRRKWLNSHNELLPAFVTDNYLTAIYAGDTVPVTSANRAFRLPKA